MIKLMHKMGLLARFFTLPIMLILFVSACQEKPAVVTLQLKNFSFKHIDGLNRFTHDRAFREHSNIGVTLNRGKICIEDNKTCVEAEVNYRIDPKSTFLQKGHHFATPLKNDIVTLEYWGVDDAGSDIKIKMTLEVNGEKVTAK